MSNSEKPKASLPRTIVEALPSSIKMAKLVDQLDDLLRAIEDEAIEARKQGATQLARAFVVMHRLDDKIETFYKNFGALFDAYKTIVFPEVLENSRQKHIALSEGFRITVSYPYRASIRKGMKDDAYVWLANHKMSDLIIGTVNASTLAAAAKHLINEENRDLPPRLFNVVQTPSTSVTQLK